VPEFQATLEGFSNVVKVPQGRFYSKISLLSGKVITSGENTYGRDYRRLYKGCRRKELELFYHPEEESSPVHKARCQ